MNTSRGKWRMASLAVLFLALSLVVAGCAPFGSTAPRLRITNAGTVPIENLVVLFPEEEVEFGDVPAGATTDYQPVSNGVYRYAAYRFDLAGSSYTQPVLDWVGEEPIEGEAFTYIIDLDPSRDPVFLIQLQQVQQDQ
ncbi:MAG TPA: hypothetical protein VLC52_00800 [Anaerolineae bacterium]|nr:hypothetical protein [Anaerolineae bacterium]